MLREKEMGYEKCRTIKSIFLSSRDVTTTPFPSQSEKAPLLPHPGEANDIPMMSLCRVIEIDLREMLGEKELPPGIESKKGVLM